MISNNEEMKEVIIYTDGGCVNNPGPGGYGVVCCMANIGKSYQAVIN